MAKLKYQVEVERWPHAGTFTSEFDMLEAARDLRGDGWWWQLGCGPDLNGMSALTLTVARPKTDTTPGQSVTITVGTVCVLAAGILEALTVEEFATRFGVAP